MKRKITVTTIQQVEIDLPVYRKSQYGFYKIYEKGDSMRVITCSDSLICDLFHTDEIDKQECQPEEFYEAFAKAVASLSNLAGIQNLDLQQSDEYMQQVAEECKDDCRPDTDELEQLEEMEYRSRQIGSL